MMLRRMLGGENLAPIDIWAVGEYTGGLGDLGKPIVYYKPKNDSVWQLKYIGAEISSLLFTRFHSGCRFAGDAAGSIWAGCIQGDNLQANATTKFAARSTDYGATWSYINRPLTGSSGQNTKRYAYGICSPAAGQIVVSVYSDFQQHLTCYGGVGGLSFCGTLGTSPTPDFLFLPAAESPNGVDTLVCIPGNSGLPAPTQVMKSLDYGATWSTAGTLTLTTGSPDNNHLSIGWPTHPKFDGRNVTLLGAIISGVHISPSLVVSQDLTTWSESEVPINVATTGFTPSGAGSKRRGRIVVTSEIVTGLLRTGNIHKTRDTGATWSLIGADALFRMRMLGNRFYGVVAGRVYSSVSGVTWDEETLPDPGVSGVIFRDVFG